MGLIQEEIEHPRIPGVELMVDTHDKMESREPWDIVTLSTSFANIDSPDQLIDLGLWLIENGNRIKNEYTPKGRPKTTTV